MLKVYLASYYDSYGYGAFDELEYVIVANSASEALGMALEAEQGTVAKHWSIEELPLSPGATMISDSGC